MKILQLLGNTAFGGATHMVTKIACRLRQDGHDVAIMANDEETKKHFRALNFACDQIDQMGRSIHPAKDTISILKLRRYVKENKIDVIHSHTSKGGIYSRALKILLPRVQIVHTVHGYYLKMDGSYSDKVTYAIERFFHRFADITTYVNRYDYELAGRWPKHSRNILIYNGVNLEEFSPRHKDLAVGQHHKKTGSDVIIGISARIVHEKGYCEFVDLIEQYLYDSSVKFEILGTGPDETFYIDRINTLIKGANIPQNKVTFYGYTQNVSDVIGKWDINVLPSYREGLSISLIEASAMGVPSVATRIRGNVEIIDENVSGLLYEPKDSQGLIENIKRLLGDGALRVEMGHAARLRAETLFSEKKMLNDFSSIMSKIEREQKQR